MTRHQTCVLSYLVSRNYLNYRYCFQIIRGYGHHKQNLVGTVAMMERIIRRAEKALPHVDPLAVTSPRKMIVEVIGNLTYNAVNLIPDKIDAVITATRSGYTAKWISKFRPPVPVFAVTANNIISRKLRLLWGVHPITQEQLMENVDDLVQASTQVVYDRGFIDKNKDIVFTSGVHIIPGRTNVVGVFHIKDLVS